MQHLQQTFKKKKGGGKGEKPSDNFTAEWILHLYRE